MNNVTSLVNAMCFYLYLAVKYKKQLQKPLALNEDSRLLRMKKFCREFNKPLRDNFFFLQNGRGLWEI